MTMGLRRGKNNEYVQPGLLYRCLHGLHWVLRVGAVAPWVQVTRGQQAVRKYGAV